MAGDDYNNLFSPDYWSPDGYAKRKAAEKSNAKKIANYQDTARGNEWGAIGDFLGGIGKFFANAGTDPNIGSNAREDSPFRRNAGVEASSRKLQNENSGRGVGRVPKHSFFDMQQQKDPLEELFGLLNEKYQGSAADTSFLDNALNAQIGAINDARNQAQQNFNTSDANLAGMHSAFQHQIMDQAPKIQEQTQQHQNDLNAVFNQTLSENNDRAQANKAADMEMFQRLGIAPAANRPDLVGQAIEEGNQRTVGSRDARLAEAQTIGNSELERNTAAANSVGAAGVQRRSDLNMRLQDILGQLGGKEADIRSQYQTALGSAAKEEEQRAYERFLNDRNWNMDRYNQEMDYRLKQQEQNANGNEIAGFNGLQATTDPQVQQAIVDVISTEPNMDIRNPNQVMIALRKKYPNINPDAAFAWLAQYNNLGSTNKFPVG